MAQRVKNNWIYTGDKGVNFAIHAAADLTAQAAVLGGSDLVDKSLYAMPSNLTPRKAEVFNAAEGTRLVVCYEPTATLYTTPGTAVTLPVFNDLDGAVFTSTGKVIAENQRGNNPLT